MKNIVVRNNKQAPRLNYQFTENRGGTRTH